mgnify:CR=1 FL=1
MATWCAFVRRRPSSESVGSRLRIRRHWSARIGCMTVNIGHRSSADTTWMVMRISELRTTVRPVSAPARSAVLGSTAREASATGGVITQIGADHLLPVATTDVDAGGKYLLPGIIDPHVHLGIGPGGGPDKLVRDFDTRFPRGPVSLADATGFTVHGDWTFGAGVRVVGEVSVPAEGSPGTIDDGTVLEGS